MVQGPTIVSISVTAALSSSAWNIKKLKKNVYVAAPFSNVLPYYYVSSDEAITEVGNGGHLICEI